MVAILAGEDPDEIAAGWRSRLKTFEMRRRPFLLYE